MKDLAEIVLRDDRSRYFAASVDEVHKRLAEIELTSRTPNVVLSLFETAKNLSLYAWHVYEFHAVADLVAFQSLELAVRLRAEQEGIKERRKSFSELITLAVDLGWIVESKMPDRLDIARKRIETRRIAELVRDGSRPDHNKTWIAPPTDAEVESEANDMQIAQSVCRAAVRLRNALAHGRHYTLPNSDDRLTTAAALINQLFS